MKFKFPLQKVLEHRKVVENIAQKDFQDAVAVLNEYQTKLDKMRQDILDAQARAGSLLQAGGAQGPALVQIHEFLKGHKIRIQQQEQNIHEIEKIVEAKREILRQAALDYKIMEKTRENQFEEYKAERKIQDQKEMDEQAILRFKGMKES
ncbi:flagellar export protein FliJ [Bdellovibrio sp. SKB1291214]|uniref:flagellar export protein FliJ n=1 Tax=Bdellovibrio sp. SKB1291214 TaxID=1732569 RepID=UPI0022407B9B|nr:flagellar export protein FliJ [Bdellovibrio sp. SKB1291214]UYL08745.1 flagellar export protein FliJ [Bdellovibrio sp. SKB1291214]